MTKHAVPAGARFARQRKRSFATATAESSGSSCSAAPVEAPVKIFCDLDGVLADFDAGVLRACGRLPSEMAEREMWSRLARTPGFFEQLPWMPEARELWEAIKPLKPTILTGMPRGSWAEAQKRAWCRRHLGEDVPVITCMSAKKHVHCTPNSILIDDRKAVVVKWAAAGGIAIHHADVKSSLQRLNTVVSSDLSLESATHRSKRQHELDAACGDREHS